MRMKSSEVILGTLTGLLLTPMLFLAYLSLGCGTTVVHRAKGATLAADGVHISMFGLGWYSAIDGIFLLEKVPSATDDPTASTEGNKFDLANNMLRRHDGSYRIDWMSGDSSAVDAVEWSYPERPRFELAKDMPLRKLSYGLSSLRISQDKLPAELAERQDLYCLVVFDMLQSDLLPIEQ